MFFRRSRRSTHPSQADLSAYIDGELAVAVARTIGHHAETCRECRSQLAELRDTKALLAGLPRAALPRSFILSAAQLGERRPALVARPSPLRFVPAMALSLFVALVLVDVASLPSGSNDASSGAPSGGLTAKSSAESADTAQRPQTTTAAGNVPALAPAPSSPPAAGAAGAAADAGAVPQAAPVEGFAPPSPSPAEQAARSALTAPTVAVAPPVPAAVPSIVAPSAEQPQDSGTSQNSSGTGESSGIGLLRLLQVLAAGGFVVSLLVLVWPKLTRKEFR